MKQAGRDSESSRMIVSQIPGQFLPPADGLTVEEQTLWAKTVPVPLWSRLLLRVGNPSRACAYSRPALGL